MRPFINEPLPSRVPCLHFSSTSTSHFPRSFPIFITLSYPFRSKSTACFQGYAYPSSSVNTCPPPHITTYLGSTLSEYPLWTPRAGSLLLFQFSLLETPFHLEQSRHFSQFLDSSFNLGPLGPITVHWCLNCLCFPYPPPVLRNRVFPTFFRVPVTIWTQSVLSLTFLNLPSLFISRKPLFSTSFGSLFTSSLFC